LGSCEQSFSDFGITHTKLQNTLSAEKVHKPGVVKMDLRHAHSAAGLTGQRQKWKFGEDDGPLQEDNLNCVDSSPLAEDGSIDVCDLIDELVCDSNNDTLQDDDPIPVLAVPSFRAASQQCIPLASLFSFVEPAGTDCLQFYWKGGLKNLEHEVAAYDLLQGGDLGMLDWSEHHSNTMDSNCSL
jgi:hypothetical protein